MLFISYENINGFTRDSFHDYKFRFPNYLKNVINLSKLLSIQNYLLKPVDLGCKLYIKISYRYQKNRKLLHNT